MTNNFETIERFESNVDPSGYSTWHQSPDFNTQVSTTLAEFIFKAGAALKEFREQWIQEHQGQWEESLELDNIPVLCEGMIAGYLYTSEIDGKSYDFSFPKRVEPEESDEEPAP